MKANASVDGNIHITEFFSGNPVRIACLQDLLRNPLDRFFPRDLLPVISAGRPVLRPLQSIRRGVSGEHRYAFDAERSAIDNVVKVTFHGDELAFAHGSDHAASTRTKVTRGCVFVDIGELQGFIRGSNLSNV